MNQYPVPSINALASCPEFDELRRASRYSPPPSSQAANAVDVDELMAAQLTITEHMGGSRGPNTAREARERMLCVATPETEGMKAAFFEFLRMRETGQLIDVHFRVGHHTFPAHRCVVSSQSRPLSRMLCNTAFVESGQSVIELNEVNAKAFGLVIDFMYSKPVLIRANEVMDVLSEACKWDVKPLMQTCCDALSRVIDAGNCWDLLQAAEHFSLQELGMKAFDFVCVNFGASSRALSFLNTPLELLVKVVSSDRLWLHHEMTIFDACSRWVRHDPARRLPAAPHLLAHVHFFRMSAGQLAALAEHELVRRQSVIARMHSEATQHVLGLHIAAGAGVGPRGVGVGVGMPPAASPRDAALAVVNRRCTGTMCQKILRSHSDAVMALAVVGDCLISGSSDNTIKVWNTDTWELEQTLVGHSDWVVALCVVGGKLVSGSEDRTIRVWDMATWRCEVGLDEHAEGVSTLHVVGDRLVSGSSSGDMKVWDTATWKCQHTLYEHDDCIRAMAVVQGHLVTASYDRTLKVWDTATWQCLHTLRGHTDWVVSLAAIDERLVSGSEDHTIRVWNAKWEEERVVQEKDTVTALAHIDGKLVSAVNDDTIKVWDMNTWVCESIMPEGAESVNTDFVNDMLVVDGKLAVGSADGNVRLIIPGDGHQFQFGAAPAPPAGASRVVPDRPHVPPRMDAMAC